MGNIPKYEHCLKQFDFIIPILPTSMLYVKGQQRALDADRFSQEEDSEICN